MSTKFSDLIDKESILLDRKRLADFNMSKRNKIIDNIRDEFIENNVDGDNLEVVMAIYKVVEEIKGGI